MKRFLLLTVLAFFGCTLFAQPADSLVAWERGYRHFSYIYEPLVDKPIEVYYYIPRKGNVTQMRVLFAMHGADRSGSTALKCWLDFAEQHGFVVIAPEFSRDFFNENAYQFGNVYETKEFKVLNPRDKWVYSSIESIFDYFIVCNKSAAEFYDMYGHSAGGQFTHRYVIALCPERLNIAVAANPGTWTFPLVDGLVGESGHVYGWPYSIYNTPFDSKEHIEAIFAKKLYIQTGTMDTATSGEHVPTDEAALAEGKNRHDRAIRFHKCAQSAALSLGINLNWNLVKVNGIGHQGKGMVYGIFDLQDGRRVYDTSFYTTTGAYYLIFEAK